MNSYVPRYDCHFFAAITLSFLMVHVMTLLLQLIYEVVLGYVYGLLNKSSLTAS